ncbi:MAG: hypothetical protein ABW352_15210 [Polyangiales bacterium]
MPVRVYKDEVWQGDFYGTTLSFGYAGTWPGQGPDIRGDGDYQLYAVDVAGNRSDAVNVSVSGCGQVSPRDAGFPPYPYTDGGTPTDASVAELDASVARDADVARADASTEVTAAPSMDDDGCALVSSRSSSLWAALGLLALLRRRQTRSR